MPPAATTRGAVGDILRKENLNKSCRQSTLFNSTASGGAVELRLDNGTVFRDVFICG